MLNHDIAWHLLLRFSDFNRFDRYLTPRIAKEAGKTGAKKP